MAERTLTREPPHFGDDGLAARYTSNAAAAIVAELPFLLAPEWIQGRHIGKPVTKSTRRIDSLLALVGGLRATPRLPRSSPGPDRSRATTATSPWWAG